MLHLDLTGINDRKFYLQQYLGYILTLTQPIWSVNKRRGSLTAKYLSEFLLATGERGDKRLKADNCQESLGSAPNA